MGSRGPVPKKSGQRRRTNSPEPEQAETPAVDIEIPAPDDAWHDAARRWYESLADSGQSKFYEPSDWATAWLIAESISRELKPQVVGMKVNPDTGAETGEPVWATLPMKGASLSAYLKAMTTLLVTEGDRRRAGLELVRAAPTGERGDTPPGVTELDEYRSRLAG